MQHVGDPHHVRAPVAPLRRMTKFLPTVDCAGTIGQSVVNDGRWGGHTAQGGSMPRRQQSMPGGRYGLTGLIVAIILVVVILRYAGIL